MVEENYGSSVPDLVQAEGRFNLRRAFLLRQQQLLATLGVGRAIGGHPLAIGDSSELNWSAMLESILPARYRVSKAFVVDADGDRSDQIDLLIHDRQYSPVLVAIGEYAFVPAEAVYAVLEIKQEMDRKSILYASDKVASVRRLRRTSAPIPHAGGVYGPRQPAQIIGGLLSMECGWAAGLSGPLEAAWQEAIQEGRLDVGCALRAGSFEARPDREALKVSGSETALIFFVLRLLSRLQAMATVPAIDYGEYGSVLDDG